MPYFRSGSVLIIWVIYSGIPTGTSDSGQKRWSGFTSFRRMPESRWLSQQVIIQIPPMGIFCLNNIDFPCALPVLDRFLALDRRLHCLMHFIPNQIMNSVFTGKSFHHMMFVFPNPLQQIGSHSCIQCPAALAGQQVDTRLSFHTGLLASTSGFRHAPEWRADDIRIALFKTSVNVVFGLFPVIRLIYSGITPERSYFGQEQKYKSTTKGGGDNWVQPAFAD